MTVAERFHKDTPEFRAWILTRFDRPNGDDGCWLWLGAKFAGGYGSVTFNGNSSTRVHRLMYSLFRGPIGQGLDVCHTCDTPICANPSHLFLGNARDNALDSVAKGRNRCVIHRGESAGSSKLTDQQVRTIKASPLSTKVLAAEYGVVRTTIQRIRSGARWTHIDGGER